ncbi:hypothetical protein EalM132_00080 [Exiguobacterium phage vB_EalM-132]|nr:hypothetical protein EalM132_00080 [Exiguobacterium phage vB_EalM-132]
MESEARLQPHLGKPQERYKPGDDSNSLLLAKVTKVHHKHGTVDLQIIKSNSTINSDASTEGRFGARVATATAHYNPETLSTSGTIEPIQEGQLVMVAFLDGLLSQPVIIGSFHQTWESENNILPDIYPLVVEDSIYDLREATKYLKVHPSQFYERVDGIGAKEVSHPSKTFMQIDPDLYDEISDGHKAYDHDNLHERDPLTGSSRSARDENSAFPVKILYVHRSSFMDDDTTWTKFFVDSTGTFRLTRDNNDGALTFMEVEEKGGFKIRRQEDSPNHDDGATYSEFSMDVDGDISLMKSIEGKQSGLTINGRTGDITLQHKDGAYLKLTAKGLEGDSSSGGGSGITVSKTMPTGVPDGHLWIDISDIGE